jgi:hypothetical protein
MHLFNEIWVACHHGEFSLCMSNSTSYIFLCHVNVSCNLITAYVAHSTFWFKEWINECQRCHHHGTNVLICKILHVCQVTQCHFEQPTQANTLAFLLIQDTHKFRWKQACFLSSLAVGPQWPPNTLVTLSI